MKRAIALSLITVAGHCGIAFAENAPKPVADSPSAAQPAAPVAAPSGSAHAAELARRADYFHSEDRIYFAAGKPATTFMARYYADLSQKYLKLAAKAGAHS